MLNILFVSRDTTSMTALKTALEESDVLTTWAESGSYALSLLAERDVDLIVTDENIGDMTGLEFIKTAIAQKPMINYAAVSSLLPDDFHEVSEGLGTLMQLPVNPGQKDAQELLERLKIIQNMAAAAM
ncbi:MAG: response regulator [Deltaproteobacteria bacterium]|nr:response regulator [Deltaproteobacteria bacterium]